MASTQINLDDFPDSAYAQELRRNAWDLHFVGSLEADYVASHVDRTRLRARVWFTAVMLMSGFFTTQHLRRTGITDWETLLNVMVLLPCAVVLAWLSWSRRYSRWFLSGVRIFAPISYITVSTLIARGIARNEDQFASYIVNVLAVFFFTGLMFREAVATAAGMLLAFVASAVWFHVPTPMLIQDVIVLMMAVIIGAIVHRDVEKSYRVGFLEAALIGELAARDGLTGLMNRRSFDEHLVRVWAHAMRDRQSIAVLMIDIDHFKEYNDGFGHQAGDVALRSVARSIQEFARRPLDVAARFGGEEFVVIFYDLPFTHVRDMAENIRQRVLELQIQRPRREGVQAGPVSVSIGVGLVSPTVGRTPQGAVQLADEALYEAKREGRNRIVVRGAEAYRLLDTGAFKSSHVIRLQSKDGVSG